MLKFQFEIQLDSAKFVCSTDSTHHLVYGKCHSFGCLRKWCDYLSMKAKTGPKMWCFMHCMWPCLLWELDWLLVFSFVMLCWQSHKGMFGCYYDWEYLGPVFLFYSIKTLPSWSLGGERRFCFPCATLFILGCRLPHFTIQYSTFFLFFFPHVHTLKQHLIINCCTSCNLFDHISYENFQNK